MSRAAAQQPDRQQVSTEPGWLPCSARLRDCEVRRFLHGERPTALAFRDRFHYEYMPQGQSATVWTYLTLRAENAFWPEAVFDFSEQAPGLAQTPLQSPPHNGESCSCRRQRSPSRRRRAQCGSGQQTSSQSPAMGMQRLRQSRLQNRLSPPRTSLPLAAPASACGMRALPGLASRQPWLRVVKRW